MYPERHHPDQTCQWNDSRNRRSIRAFRRKQKSRPSSPKRLQNFDAESNAATSVGKPAPNPTTTDENCTKPHQTRSMEIMRQVGVFNTDDLHTIFNLAGSAEEKCARDAAITLGNLAVVTRNQQAIADAGGLIPLVTMLSGNPYVSCQKFAARALYRLAAHGENKPRVVGEGALPPLVRRLRSPDAEVAR